jgi:hypothetical protein
MRLFKGHKNNEVSLKKKKYAPPSKQQVRRSRF